jgi:hypothetical protein
MLRGQPGQPHTGFVAPCRSLHCPRHGTANRNARALAYAVVAAGQPLHLTPELATTAWATKRERLRAGGYQYVCVRTDAGTVKALTTDPRDGPPVTDNRRALLALVAELSWQPRAKISQSKAWKPPAPTRRRRPPGERTFIVARGLPRLFKLATTLGLALDPDQHGNPRTHLPAAGTAQWNQLARFAGLREAGRPSAHEGQPARWSWQAGYFDSDYPLVLTT